MDFNKFDSVSAAESGADLHLKHPATMEPLYGDDGSPCIVTLLGGEASAVRAALRDMQKKRAAQEDDDKDERTLEDIHELLVEGLIPRVVGFKNVFRGSKPATKKDADWFFNLNRLNGQEGEESFAEQASKFSSSREAYLGNGSLN